MTTPLSSTLRVISPKGSTPAEALIKLVTIWLGRSPLEMGTGTTYLLTLILQLLPSTRLRAAPATVPKRTLMLLLVSGMRVLLELSSPAAMLTSISVVTAAQLSGF